MRVDDTVRRKALLAIYRELNVSASGRLFRETLAEHWQQTGLRITDLDRIIAVMAASGLLAVTRDDETGDQLITLTNAGFKASQSLPGGVRGWIAQLRSGKTLLFGRRRAQTNDATTRQAPGQAPETERRQAADDQDPRD